MRRSDWPERLAAVIDGARDRSFGWGVHDCCLFACDCIEAISGIDPAKDFRGRYNTMLGAYRRMAEFIGDEIPADRLVERTAERICQNHGAPEIPPTTAARGDVVVVREDGRDVLGIVWSRAIYLTSEDGLVTRPLPAIRRAWRF